MATTSTLTKETGTRTGGSGSRVLRVTMSGDNPINGSEIWAEPTSLTLEASTEYQINGWVRSDATNEFNPFVKLVADGEPDIDIFTPAGYASWQDFSITYTTPSYETTLRLGGIKSGTPSGALYWEFDDVEIWKTEDEASDPLLYWTEGNDATLAKDTTEVYAGEQSLEVAGADDYSKQSVTVDVVGFGLVENAYRMHDAGANNIYDASSNNDHIDNAESLTNPAGLTAASNATDATALEFDGVADGAGGSCQSLLSAGAISAWVKVTDATRAPTFRLKPTASGYKALPAAITIDGTTVQPAIRLEGEDADLTSWDDTVNGNAFGIAGSGSDPTFDELTPGIDNKRVKLNAGKVYEAPNSSIGQLSTDDFVVEFIYTHNDGTVEQVASRRGASGTEGITFYTSSSVLYLQFGTSASGIVTVALGTGLVEGCSYHVLVFADRSGNAKGFVNGSDGTALSISAHSAAGVGDSYSWTLGARGESYAQPYSEGLSYLSLWHSPSWLSTADQAGVAAERFARCCGVYAGTAQTITSVSNADGAVPQTQSRSTEAYLEKWNIAETEAYLIPVGDDWIRTDKIKDDSGTLKLGVRSENSRTNLLLYSEDFSNAAWTKTGATIGTAITGLGEQNFDAITASVDNDTHYVEQAVTVTADDQSLSVYAKAGNVDGLKIAINEDATQYAYFDLTNGTVGTEGAGLEANNSARIEPKGDGIYRCEIRYLSGGTTATVRFYATDGETDSWTGDGSTPSLYLFGAQLVDDNGNITSYIKTTSATATRTIDELYYHAYENIGGNSTNTVPESLSVKVNVFVPVKTSLISGFGGICGLDDGSTANRVSLSILSGASLRYFVVSGGVNQVNETDVSRDYTDFKTFDLQCAANNFNGYENRSLRKTDTSGSMPANLTLIKVSRNLDANPIDKVTSELEISPYSLTYPRGLIFASAGVEGPFISYDDLTGEGTSFELRASGDRSGTVTLNGGTLSPDTWYHVMLGWSAGTAVLYVDGSAVDSAAAGSFLGLNTIHAGWVGYLDYDETDTATAYTVAYGEASIADLRLWGAGSVEVPAALLAAMVAQGEPPYERGLVHQIGSQFFNSGEFASDAFFDHVSGLIMNQNATLSAYTEGATEAGYGINSFPGDALELEASTASDAMASTDFTFQAYVRIEGDGDQLIFANGAENSTTWHALYFQDSSDTLIYSRVIGATLRSVSAPVEKSKLYNVTVICDYDGSTNTTMRIAIDGEYVLSQIYAGAPNVTEDTLVMFQSGGSPTMQFYGFIVGSRFYDVAMTLAELQALSTRLETIVEAGVYATQTITPTALNALFSGAHNSIDGAPFILYKSADDSPWRAVNYVRDVDEDAWYTSEFATPVYAIRLLVKGFDDPAYNAEFDIISGGEDPGSSSIELVEVAENKRKALEELVLTRKPLHSWAVMVIRYV